MSLSRKLSKINPSPTLSLTAQAKAMKSQGIDVISFGAGEPDFDTPLAIKTAAKNAIDTGFTKYTPATGTVELKEAIVEKLLKDNGLKYEPSQIVVSCGAKHSLYGVLQAICNPKDEVIIIAPYWVSYPEMIKLADAKVKVIKTSEKNGFRVIPKQIEKAITKKTKALILNSPSNPAGVIYSEKELKEIADIVVKNNIYVISDEIYEKLTYDGEKHISIASFGEDIKAQTITVNGVSKAYSMTGWRIGYLAASKDIVKGVSLLQEHSTSNPSSISQKAALEALKMDERTINKMTEEFSKRRTLMSSLLDKIDKITYFNPKGAFYMYCDISKTKMKAADLARKLLDDKKVVVIPGEAFGSDKHIRLSFATSSENITKGLDRLKTWLEQL
ncbi:MAG: pyridoxal phosphate-dependent aminotransferase [Candidatus Omnitrophica bacterium]|nr:pyridoxal phosphate-dependent aminotransferase [Candidatus Omnitrophota bacterium]